LSSTGPLIRTIDFSDAHGSTETMKHGRLGLSNPGHKPPLLLSSSCAVKSKMAFTIPESCCPDQLVSIQVASRRCHYLSTPHRRVLRHECSAASQCRPQQQPI